MPRHGAKREIPVYKSPVIRLARRLDWTGRERRAAERHEMDGRPAYVNRRVRRIEEELRGLGVGAVPDLERAFRSRSAKTAGLAARACGVIAGPALEAVPFMVAAWERGKITDAEFSGAVAAIEKRWEGDGITVGAVPALIKPLNRRANTDREVRLAVLRMLGRVGVEATCAVPVLARSLRGDLRAPILEVLRRIGPPAGPAVPELIGLMEQDRDLRPQIAMTLAAVGSLAAEAGPALIGMLNGGNSGERKAAAQALGRVGALASYGVLAEVLREDPETDVRRAAAHSLARLHHRGLARGVSDLRARAPEVYDLVGKCLRSVARKMKLKVTSEDPAYLDACGERVEKRGSGRRDGAGKARRAPGRKGP